AEELGAKELSVYARLMLVFILVESRLMAEVETHLGLLFQAEDIYLDHYIQWPGNSKRAFLAYWQGDYKKAFEYQKEVYEHSLHIAAVHQRGPENLEYMMALEEKGMRHPHWNFDSEVNRLLNWPDIYMRGAALRYRALRAYKRNEPVEAVRSDLVASMKLLEEAGARIELSHTRILLARILISNREFSAARELLNASWEVYSRVNPELFPQDLKPYLDVTSKNAVWVDSLLSVGEALSSIRKRKQLLSEIVRQAMRIVGAERGTVFLKNEEELEVAANRNMEIQQIFSPVFKPQMKIIKNVLNSGRKFIKKEIVSTSAKRENFQAVGWLGCFPIQLKSRIMGAIYMDCTLTRLDLSEDEVALLRIITNQAAVALDNLEAYEKISHMKDSLEAEANYYRWSFVTTPSVGNMIGNSKSFKEMVRMIRYVAASDTTVMLTGETGVGKDLAARAIHQYSKRSSGPFIAVNVVSLSPELIASELFGHEKGAFTGAAHTRQGRFELASEGTLFLDDIDAFSLDIQAKMLRVLETREFERVGGSRTLKTRFRLLAASNRKIEEMVEKGLFRSDFYYRLNVFPINIPPLRERKEDIPALASHFMNIFGRKAGKHFNRICNQDMQRLMDYPWPGNVREMRHVIERSVLLSNSGRLYIPPLDEAVIRQDKVKDNILSLKEAEARHIIKALEMCKGKVSGNGGAAELLEVNPTSLYSKMKRLGVKWRRYKVKED
ncbi:MAG: sigma-54-dependent Fis family transcriptional regulator, partial [Desulfobacteraceae bacterium]